MKYVTYVSQRTCGSPPVTSSRTWDSLGSSVSSSIFTIPQDLFIDTVESNNFISSALTGLFANTEDSTARLPSPLVLEALGNGGEEGRGVPSGPFLSTESERCGVDPTRLTNPSVPTVSLSDPREW
ncbi:uncharacterized protein LOC135108457 isoform X1 [Scylla paramamosain]|uniref:uncharacterized protein LOC135108457 isoform X1 n=1 Tax=Scylla paramamosain TaxID=85552 RepID=UPI003082D504